MVNIKHIFTFVHAFMNIVFWLNKSVPFRAFLSHNGANSDRISITEKKSLLTMRVKDEETLYS